MPHYKAPDNSLHYLDSETSESLLPEGSVAVSDEEARSIREASITPEERQTALSALIQDHMDSAARALGYDDLKTAVTYADEPSVLRFQQEGLGSEKVALSGLGQCYQLLAQYEVTGKVPTEAEILSSLPKLESATHG